jgi:hypothetical protein
MLLALLPQERKFSLCDMGNALIAILIGDRNLAIGFSNRSNSAYAWDVTLKSATPRRPDLDRAPWTGNGSSNVFP